MTSTSGFVGGLMGELTEIMTDRERLRRELHEARLGWDGTKRQLSESNRLLERADDMLGGAADTGDPTAPDRSMVLFCASCHGTDCNDGDECPECADGELVEVNGGEEVICTDNDGTDDADCDFRAARFVVAHRGGCELLKLRAEIAAALKGGGR